MSPARSACCSQYFAALLNGTRLVAWYPSSFCWRGALVLSSFLLRKKIENGRRCRKKSGIFAGFLQFCSNFGGALVILGHIFFVDFYFGGSGILTIGN